MPVDAETTARLRQAKFNALVSKYLHERARETLNTRNQVVDFLGIAVPTLYFVLRYYAKGTEYDFLVNAVWEFLAAVLACGTVAKMAFQWSDRAQKHSELLGENISLVGHANSLLNEDAISGESMRLFSLLDEKLERDDRSALGILSTGNRQQAYREALKEVNPGDVNVVCPFCKASPWKFKAGDCQACGNTPST